MIAHGLPPIPPLPGAGRPVRGLFIGRTGALLCRSVDRPCAALPKQACSPEALRMLFRAGQHGWNLYLIGNEESVARGRVTDAAWERFEADLLATLRGQ